MEDTTSGLIPRLSPTGNKAIHGRYYQWPDSQALSHWEQGHPWKILPVARFPGSLPLGTRPSMEDTTSGLIPRLSPTGNKAIHGRYYQWPDSQALSHWEQGHPWKILPVARFPGSLPLGTRPSMEDTTSGLIPRLSPTGNKAIHGRYYQWPDSQALSHWEQGHPWKILPVA